MLVAEALELFMISACEKTVKQARRTRSRRITPSHLKAVVMQEELFDFLRDNFAQVPDLSLLDEPLQNGPLLLLGGYGGVSEEAL